MKCGKKDTGLEVSIFEIKSMANPGDRPFRA